MPGPLPKPVALRRRRNQKPGAAELETSPKGVKVPALLNPDGRTWHPLTLEAWRHAWQSPMASQWLKADVPGLARLAVLWDACYRDGNVAVMAEIRLQEAKYGLSPLDRARLGWSVKGGGEMEPKPTATTKPASNDPRRLLRMVDTKTTSQSREGLR